VLDGEHEGLLRRVRCLLGSEDRPAQRVKAIAVPPKDVCPGVAVARSNPANQGCIIHWLRRKFSIHDIYLSPAR
jgi:hypothetical protein